MTGPQQRRSAFAVGLAAGAFAAAFAASLLLYILSNTGHLSLTGPLSPPAGVSQWIFRNLGLSLPVFALVALLFSYSLHDVLRQVRNDACVEDVAHSDHLADIWVSVFFGIGVIWTAIGMRNALLFALGDPEATMQAGAFALLQRMVDGGILVALSTTIFGGIGGYLMRIVKTLVIGNELKAFYAGHMEAGTNRTRATLDAMESHLRSLAEPVSRSKAGSDV